MRKRRGFVIITALVVAAALSIMAGAYSLSMVIRNQVIMRYINSVKAYYLAASGIQYELCDGACSYYIYWDWWPIPEPITLSVTDSGDTISIEYEKISCPRGYGATYVDDPPGYILITRSTAKVKGVPRMIVSEMEVTEFSSDQVWSTWSNSPPLLKYRSEKSYSQL